ncbi:DUF4326 domain-containing protein [Streptomyces sp. MN6]
MTSSALPRRVQRTRPHTKGERGIPPGARYVGRGTRYGNPFRVVPYKQGRGKLWRVIDTGDRSTALREEPVIVNDPFVGRVVACRLYELHTSPIGLYPFTDDDLAELRRELVGLDLACWCPLPEPGQTDWCHAAHLLALANPDPRLTA